MTSAHGAFADLFEVAKGWALPVGAFAFLVVYPLVSVWPVHTRPRAEPDVATDKKPKKSKAGPQKRWLGFWGVLAAALLVAKNLLMRHPYT